MTRYSMFHTFTGGGMLTNFTKIKGWGDAGD